MSKFAARKQINMNRKLSALISLSPLLVFLCVYLVSSLVAGDFYLISVPAAFLVACVYAVIVSKGKLSMKMEALSRGAGHPKVLLMIWIFILAGAFAASAKQIGAVDATVALIMGAVPGRLMLVGLFVASCFISMAIGTSVGTIVALVPIASGIAAKTGLAPEFITALVVGGAFFGDNLSFISDTTIASTQAAGCEMADKFKANLKMALPAFLVCAVIYFFCGRNLEYSVQGGSAQWFKCLPYVLVIILALCRLNVCTSLACGILSNAVIGFCCSDFGWTGFLSTLGDGISSMSELIIVTLLAGGLLELIRVGGGLDLIVSSLTRRTRSKAGAELSIAAIVSLSNFCTANNTIAIITSGSIAKDISTRFGISPQRTASLLDVFSCLVQGLIPYGAQLLMASGMAGISPASIIPYLYYPFLLGGFALLSILFSLRRSNIPEF